MINLMLPGKNGIEWPIILGRARLVTLVPPSPYRMSFCGDGLQAIPEVELSCFFFLTFLSFS